jgi:hypothetical protein
MSSSFRRAKTLTVSIKRNPAVNGTTGKRGVPATVLTGLKATPLDPASADVLLRTSVVAAVNGQPGVTPAVQLLQTFLETTGEVLHGDVLNVTSVDRGTATPYTIVGKDYPIVALESSQWRKTLSYLLVLQYTIETVD